MSKFSDEEQEELTQIQEYHSNKQRIKQLEQQLSEAQFNYEDCRGECNRAEDLIADLQEQLYESRQNTAREIFKNFDPWFTSGNAISVERATILTRDYLAIKARFGLEG